MGHVVLHRRRRQGGLLPCVLRGHVAGVQVVHQKIGPDFENLRHVRRDLLPEVQGGQILHVADVV